MRDVAVAADVRGISSWTSWRSDLVRPRISEHAAAARLGLLCEILSRLTRDGAGRGGEARQVCARQRQGQTDCKERCANFGGQSKANSRRQQIHRACRILHWWIHISHTGLSCRHAVRTVAVGASLTAAAAAGSLGRAGKSMARVAGRTATVPLTTC